MQGAVAPVCIISVLFVRSLAFFAMVNDTIDIGSHILDFDLDASASQQQQTLQHSASNNTLQISTAKIQQKVKNEKLAKADKQDKQEQRNSVNLQILPSSAENLSWTFFEEVSTLDNQLRGNEELSAPPANSCHLMTTSPKQVYATQEAIEAELVKSRLDAPQEIIARKQNGFTPMTNALPIANDNTKICDHILSQQSPDVIQKQQQDYKVAIDLQLDTAKTATTATFQFTSPTATFKRKKQQQQKQFEHQLHNNNNCYNNQTAVINNSLPIEQQQQLNSKSPSRISVQGGNVQHAPATNISVVLNGIGAPKATKATNPAIVDDILGLRAGASGGTGGCHIDNLTTTATNIRTPHHHHTLPRFVTTTTTTTTATKPLPRAAAYAADKLDLVGSHTSKSPLVAFTNSQLNGHNKRQRATPKVKPAQRQHQQQSRLQQQALPKRMPTGAAGGSGSANGSGSGNSSNYSNNNNNNTLHKGNSAFMDSLGAHLELVGWRKKCLYGLLVLLMLLIITNLVLTLWILKVMEFTTDGMGQLKIVPGGIQLTGQALIMDMLRASTIRSRHGQPIAIESSRNFSINTRDANGMLENHLFLGHDKLECLAKEIRINDTNGRNLFSVNQNEVTIGAHALRIDGEGGAIFRESIQTPHVRAEPGRELRLESPTRQLELTAAKDINLQSRAGAIEVTALKDVRLSALDGSLRLESSKILMPNLRTAQPPSLGAPQSRDHLHRVFQLCACSNGKLFLAAPHSICAGDDSTVCR
ncbi:uncharacterized protein LOC129237113 [Anastrepha obliqua]|uniref:uncharacterized protein LOC129237113 n=1 Tax=Anastrepha obliqua TaxID=95512 RepID=UPI002409C1C0|nr:uncharacterized protein LOC129237113 [Anastrepha obliqua]